MPWSRWKGTVPVSSCQATHASAYWSARPSTARPLTCSGEVYAGVPRNWPVPVSRADDAAPLLIPKSDRYTCSGRPGPVSTKTFAGLTSRCTSPAPCAASSADATGDSNPAIRPGASGPSRASTPRRSPPVTSRMAMNSAPPAWPAS